MSADKNSMFVAAVIVSGAVAATLGMVIRDRVDLPTRPSVATTVLPGTKMASKQDPQEAIDIPEREYFEQMVDMLKTGYVEPISDEQKLVSGSVRGMVVSLEDMNSIYMDKDEFRVFQNAREGQYEGIGADLIYVLPPKSKDPNDLTPRMPHLVVGAVTPGGPADKAGVKAGDEVDTVDGRWIVNYEVLDQFRELQKKVNAKQASVEDLRKLRNELRAKTEHSILPTRAKDKLVAGTGISIKVAFRRGAQLIQTTLQKESSKVSPVVSANGGYQVRLIAGVGQALAKALPAVGSATLDLRNNAFADVSTVTEALNALAVKGNYGKIVNSRGGSTPLASAGDRKSAPQYRLLVDSSTRGGAAMLAEALKAKGAKLEGTPSSDQSAIEVVKLPDGSGFTLNKGSFKAEVSK